MVKVAHKLCLNGDFESEEPNPAYWAIYAKLLQ
jgi:hypothetical protein